MPRFYQPDLTASFDSPFIRDGNDKLIRRSYWLARYREERLTVRRRGGRKRALGTRAPMIAAQLPNDRWSVDFAADQFIAYSGRSPKERYLLLKSTLRS
jgi:hypothetical protein